MLPTNEPVTLASPLRSRIIWVQASALLSVLAVVASDPSIGVFLDMETKIRLLAAISIAQSLITAYIRTFQTGKPIIQKDTGP